MNKKLRNSLIALAVLIGSILITSCSTAENNQVKESLITIGVLQDIDYHSGGAFGADKTTLIFDNGEVITSFGKPDTFQVIGGTLDVGKCYKVFQVADSQWSFPYYKLVPLEKCR
jgi:hypothetical protein